MIMKRNFKQVQYWLPLLALSATLTAPQVTAPAHAGLFSMSERDEVEAGQEVAAQAEREYGGVLSYNDPVSVRVRAIGQQFAAKSERRNIPYTYKVLNNDKVLNAFAAPGGPIYVTRKLVQTTANDAELAYVLGHETAHIDRKHIVKAVERQQKAGLLVGVLGSILGGGKSGNVVGAIGNVAFTVWTRGYGREQETESDIVGTRWMSQLGYDPNAAISMLGKLEGGGGGGVLDKYLSTHPNPKNRQAEVQQIIAKENLMDIARRSGGPRLAMAGANWNTGHNSTGYNTGYDNGANNYPAYNEPGTSYPTSDYPTSNYPTSNYPTSNYPANDYPTSNPTSSNGGPINFGAPIALLPRQNGNIVMAPVLETARWAGASARYQNNATIIQRGRNTLTLRRNSKTATINGRNLTMSAPVTDHNGRLYAPLGTVIQGLGGQASYEASTRTVWITLDNQRGYISLQ